MVKKVVKPLYQQVALKLAEAIAKGEYKEGDKLNARSTIAQTYQVSAETARRAVQVLDDLGIMESRHGSGTYISSRDKAVEFTSQYEDIDSLVNIRAELQASFNRQKAEIESSQKLLEEFFKRTQKTHQANPLLPYEIKLTNKANYLGKTAAELALWQETGATIIAILHEDELIVSPGPYARFEEGETIFFIGNEHADQRVYNFFYQN